MEIRQFFLTRNDCFKQGRKIAPDGIVVHSTGANNKKLCRYIQPDDGIIGKNTNSNDWNRPGGSKCVHAFIGADNNGNVRIYQTLPWDYKCWGCGTGSKGSCNKSYIQFEICEDGLTDREYFEKAFDTAVWLCRYLMQQYPAIKLQNVISHAEAHKRGYASGHTDCDHWLVRFGKNMDWFRNCIKEKIPEEQVWGKAEEKREEKVQQDEPQALGKPENPYPVPDYTLYRFRPDMNKDNVRWMQWALNRMNYGLEPDGKLGPATEAALKDAQKRLGLETDGRCGPATRAALSSI